MSDAGLAMMTQLVLDDGRCWGDVAADFQLADAEAIFDESDPNLHFLTRPRGGSKTTDVAGIAVAWLAAEAPLRARGYVLAANSTQAGLLVDAGAGFLANTPELDGVVIAENERLLNPETGAWVRVLPMSDSGAWGLRNARLLILDEFAQWPETRGATRVWTAVNSTVQKVNGCRLIILTSAGEPSHWSYTTVFKAAKATKALWRVSETPGPVPWQDPAQLERLRRELLPSEYERLVLNNWTEAEDRAILPEDYDIAAEDGFPWGTAPAGVDGGGHRLRHPHPGTKYVLTVDVGTRNDATVLCVAHKEPFDPNEPKGAQRVVVDHLERWQGSKKHHVTLDKVQERVLVLATEYNRAKVYADPDQFVGSIQKLNRSGVRAEEWRFNATSVGQVATALVQTFRNHAISVPHSDVLKNELVRVKLRESAPGVTRLDHDRAGHDDQAVTIGMACHILLGPKPGFGSARAFLEATKEADVIIQERKAGRAEGEDVAVRHWRRLLRQQERAKERASRRRPCAHRFRDGRCLMGCGATQS